MDDVIEQNAIALIRSGAVNNWAFAKLKAESAFSRNYILDMALCEARDRYFETNGYWLGKKKMQIARGNIARRIRSGDLKD